MPKRRPKQHVDGDVSEARISLMFLENGWICNRLASDYGEDFVVTPTNEESVGNYFIFCQVKSTNVFQGISMRCDDLLRWNVGDALVVLFVIERASGKTYFKLMTHTADSWAAILDGVITSKATHKFFKKEFEVLGRFADFARYCDLAFYINKMNQIVAMRNEQMRLADESDLPKIYTSFRALSLLCARPMLESKGYMAGDRIFRDKIVADMTKLIAKNGNTFARKYKSEKRLDDALPLFCDFVWLEFMSGVSERRIDVVTMELAQSLYDFFSLLEMPEAKFGYWLKLFAKS